MKRKLRMRSPGSFGRAPSGRLAIFLAAAAVGAFLLQSTAYGTIITRTSPTSYGLLPDGVTEVGGIVVDMVGANGNRVVTQTAASSLFAGFAGTNPVTIGTQTGFTPAVLNALGGGISEMAVRITLYDADSSPGEFDSNDLAFLINGVNFGDFTAVMTTQTDVTGQSQLTGPYYGFHDIRMDTGFFFNTDPNTLADIYSSLESTTEMMFLMDDVDPGDNYVDFTRGIDGSLMDIGSPRGTHAPEPTTLAIWSVVGGLALVAGRRRRRSA